MKIKDNRGFVGIDISIAVIILLVLVPTIMGVVYFINSSQNVTKVKNGALNIATNAIELAKGMDLSKSDSENVTDILTNVQNVYGSTAMSEISSPAVITLDDASYKLEVTVTDYHEVKDDADPNVVKTATVSVTYKVRGEEKTIDLSTVVK